MNQNTYHHQNLKSGLIEKGIEIVNECGLEQLSLRKVAIACNVSHAAPYSHFANKEELLSAMQLHITEQFSGVLEETILKYEEKPDFMVRFGKAYITFFMNKPQYFHFLFGEGSVKVDFSQDAGEGYRPFQIYKDQVLKRLANANLTEEKKHDCVLALFAFVHGLTALATMPNTMYSSGWENKLDDLITTLGISGQGYMADE